MGTFRRHRKAVQWTHVSLVIAIGAVAGLGYIVTGLRTDVAAERTRAERLTASMGTLEQRLGSAEKALADVASASGVSNLRNDIRQLERAIFGLGSAQLEYDALGELQDCVNRLISALTSRAVVLSRC